MYPEAEDTNALVHVVGHMDLSYEEVIGYVSCVDFVKNEDTVERLNEKIEELENRIQSLENTLTFNAINGRNS